MPKSVEEYLASLSEEIKAKLKTIEEDISDTNATKQSFPEIEGEEKRLVNLRRDEYIQEQIQRLKSDNEARRSYSNAIFTVTVIWMFFVLGIVVECGRNRLRLSDTGLAALITTTTANVFGFFYVVVNYLFNKDKST